MSEYLLDAFAIFGGIVISSMIGLIGNEYVTLKYLCIDIDCHDRSMLESKMENAKKRFVISMVAAVVILLAIVFADLVLFS